MLRLSAVVLSFLSIGTATAFAPPDAASTDSELAAVERRCAAIDEATRELIGEGSAFVVRPSYVESDSAIDYRLGAVDRTALGSDELFVLAVEAKLRAKLLSEELASASGDFWRAPVAQLEAVGDEIARGSERDPARASDRIEAALDDLRDAIEGHAKSQQKDSNRQKRLKIARRNPVSGVEKGNFDPDVFSRLFQPKNNQSRVRIETIPANGSVYYMFRFDYIRATYNGTEPSWNYIASDDVKLRNGRYQFKVEWEGQPAPIYTVEISGNTRLRLAKKRR